MRYYRYDCKHEMKINSVWSCYKSSKQERSCSLSWSGVYFSPVMNVISSLLDCSPDSCLFLASFLSSFFSSFFSSFGFSANSFWLFPRGFWLKAFFLLGKAKRNLVKGKKKMTKKTIRMKKATKTNKKLVIIPATN